MTPRRRATETPDLVHRLGSRRQVLVDAARARLAIIGSRAVEDLIEALEGDNTRIRAHAMPLLALIQDPRGRGPLIAMLLDEDARMREIAARCLARFPSPDTVTALERLLSREKRADVRVSAIQSLVEQCAAGQEQAFREILEVLVDGGEDPRVRIAALGALRTIRASERRGILRRLRQDPSPEVSRRAEEIEEEAAEPGDGNERASLKGLVADLCSDDYAAWNQAVHRIVGLGAPAVGPLVQEMQRRAHDPECCTRAGMVLKALGPRRCRALAEALDHVEEPLPLQVLVEVVGALGEKSLIYRLKDLIERLATKRAGDDADGFDPLQRVRAKAHLELARIGSRLAIQDLRDALAYPDQRVEIEMLAAVELIGKRDEIPALLRAYRREDRFMRERIAEVTRAIMRRERIRRTDSMFLALGLAERRALECILPPPRARRPARAPKR